MTNAELLTFVKKNPVGVICGVLTLLLAGGWHFRGGGTLFGLDFPLEIDTVPKAEKEFESKTKEARGYETNVRFSAQLKEQLDAMIAANKEVDARLVRAGQLATNYQIFYKLFTESGVKQSGLQQVGVSAKAANAAFSPVAFSVTVTGDFSQIVHFLRLLESGPRFCRVLGANCSVPSGDRNGPCTLALTVEFLGLP